MRQALACSHCSSPAHAALSSHRVRKQDFDPTKADQEEEPRSGKKRRVEAAEAAAAQEARKRTSAAVAAKAAAAAAWVRLSSTAGPARAKPGLGTLVGPAAARQPPSERHRQAGPCMRCAGHERCV